MSFPNGSAGTPSINFTNDTATGLYLRAISDMAVSVNGHAIMSWNRNSVSVNLPIQVTSGVVGKPAYSFGSDQNTGFYSQGNGSVGFSSNGVASIGFHAGGLTIPVGTTGTRPSSPDNGTIRLNTSLAVLEGYLSGSWTSLGGPGASGNEVFIQNSSPSVPTGQVYLWIQTGLANDGFTFWFEDGL